ncbi:hypothetical protein FGO68_gene7404 [Halteria grandinella]|uniref:Uncharacterized protein n=1 Tax=Halteria grandinella TaxID=5974 RepID=A0A8J8NWC6_HALGN|nr:hypothetical protein FGO68_gene7404 [Halteria grandinella]
MSYNADHRAWQQRVGNEMGAYRKFFDKIMTNNPSNLPSSLYETLNQIVNVDNSRLSMQSQLYRKNSANSSRTPFTTKNKQGYTFGGKTHINRIMDGQSIEAHLNSQSLTNSAQKIPKYKNMFQSQFAHNEMAQEDNKHEVSFDTASMTSSYVGKSKLNRARSQGHQRRTRVPQLNQDTQPQTEINQESQQSRIKVFIPKEYFKHAGYIKADQVSTSTLEQRQQPKKPQIPFKERFNEKLEYGGQKPGARKLIVTNANNTHRKVTGGGDDTASVLSKAVSLQSSAINQKSQDHLSELSRPQSSSFIKRKILDRQTRKERRGRRSRGRQRT